MPNEKRQRAGRMGGLQTYLRYGKEGMSAIGKLGGRPRLPSLSDLRQQLAPVVPRLNNTKGGKLPNSLKGLKELWDLRQRSEPVIKQEGEA